MGASDKFGAPDEVFLIQFAKKVRVARENEISTGVTMESGSTDLQLVENAHVFDALFVQFVTH